jgi:hypothetical protein
MDESSIFHAAKGQHPSHLFATRVVLDSTGGHRKNSHV